MIYFCFSFKETLSPCSAYDITVKAWAQQIFGESDPVHIETLDEGIAKFWTTI